MNRLEVSYYNILNQKSQQFHWKIMITFEINTYSLDLNWTKYSLAWPSSVIAAQLCKFIVYFIDSTHRTITNVKNIKFDCLFAKITTNNYIVWREVHIFFSWIVEIGVLLHQKIYGSRNLKRYWESDQISEICTLYVQCLTNSE